MTDSELQLPIVFITLMGFAIGRMYLDDGACPRLVRPQAAAISWSGESGPRHRPREQDRDGRGEETHK